MNELIRILGFVLNNFMRIWPILVITIPASVIIRHFHADQKIRKVFNRHWLIGVLIATAVGAIAPFCSCSVIPVIAALIASGVPIAPVMSFWLASPSMDPEIFLLSTASIGLQVAVARVLATGLMSLLGGIIAHYLIDRKRQVAPGFMTTQNQEKLSTSARNKLILKESLTTLLTLGRFLLLAYTLEALIVFYVPEPMITALFGHGILSIVKATAISIPLYTTNLSALGIVSGLMAKGLSGGAALAFLIGGATTTIPAMAAVYKIVEKKIFFLYLALATSSAFLSGFVFDWLF